MNSLLRTEHLTKSFSLTKNRLVTALSDVNLEIFSGETLGVVGESGCGKSTLAKTIMGVYPDVEGKLYFHGAPLTLRTRKDRFAFSEKVQMIFQDPYTALDPRMRVGDIVAENLVIHKVGTSEERRERVRALLEEVGLQGDFAERFPGEFSGGQRQRIGIARALALRPELLVCDEPISALDVSIQSQIINLLEQLKRELGLTYLFIAHDLNMVRCLSDSIAVMYRGCVVERAETETLCRSPLHPYTQLLSRAVLSPIPGPLSALSDGAAEHLAAPMPESGCPFSPRCPRATETCLKETPISRDVGCGHRVACHHPG